MPWPLHDVGPHQPHPKRRLCLAQHLREPPPDAPRTASTTAPLGHHRASPVHAAPVHAGLPRHSSHGRRTPPVRAAPCTALTPHTRRQSHSRWPPRSSHGRAAPTPRATGRDRCTRRLPCKK
ncbi:Os11g0291900, partial [Oryza sativa Japonica Group]